MLWADSVLVSWVTALLNAYINITIELERSLDFRNSKQPKHHLWPSGSLMNKLPPAI